MRVPLSWLREMVDWDEDADALAAALTARGVAVEAVQRPEQRPGGILAARLMAVQPHPAADRLSVARVRAGGRTATVVSGAPGMEVGTLVPWATPGAVLPDGRRIEARSLRGVLSEGMLCAADELGLPGGHEELLILHPELGEGADCVAALELDDPVLVLELTPNYAVHCQSVLGVAREVAALTGGDLRLPEAAEGSGGPPEGLALRIDEPDLCPRYVARIVQGVRHGPSPLRLAQRIARCGMRPLGGVVDVTNYVMLELGQPLHAFDLDRLEGRGVHVRCAAAGESIRTLDGQLRDLSPEDLVIADEGGAVAVAGVMGGRRTEVTGATTAVLLESATFAAAAVARTARRLGLPSEAAARFGRGVDPDMARLAADRAAHLLAAVAGARAASSAVEAGPGVRQRTVTLRGKTVRDLLGVRLSTAGCGRQLERFGFGVHADGADRLRVVIPGWRSDVAQEVDLVEEVARGYGYDRLPAALPPGDPGVALPGARRPVAAVARQACLAAGCSEARPYSFHGDALYTRMRLPEDHPWRRATAVLNPMHAGQSRLRTTLAGGLLETLAANARQRRAQAAVFEIGRVFLPAEPGARPAEPRHLGLAGYGALRPGGHAQPAEPFDFWAAKGILEEVCARAGLARGSCRWARPEGAAYPLLHPGRSAQVVAGGDADRVLGWVGELHPDVRAAFDLPEPAAVGELDLAALAAALARAGGTARFRALPRHPAVRRDVAVVTPRDLPAAEVEAAIRAAGGDLLADVQLFDVYTGEGLPAGGRGLAYALTYQADRTLTDAEVEGRHDLVRRALAALPGVALR